MRFLLDMPISPYLAAWLSARGHDAVHASFRGLQRAPDSQLLDIGAAEHRVVITADTDFPHLLALSRETTPGVILFRGGDYTTHELAELLAGVLEEIPEATLHHSICVADRKRIRCRPLPIP